MKPLHFLIPVCLAVAGTGVNAAVYLQSVPLTQVPAAAGYAPSTGGSLSAYPGPEGSIPSAHFNGVIVRLVQSAIGYPGATTEAFPASNEYFKNRAGALANEGTQYRLDPTASVELGAG